MKPTLDKIEYTPHFGPQRNGLCLFDFEYLVIKKYFGFNDKDCEKGILVPQTTVDLLLKDAYKARKMKQKDSNTGIYHGSGTIPVKPEELTTKIVDCIIMEDKSSHGPGFFKNCAWWCLVGGSIIAGAYFLIFG